MKKTALILSVFVSAIPMFAMEIECNSTKVLPLEDGASYPVLSPDGSKLLYTTDDFTGLSIFNLNDKTAKVIDESPAAGHNPVFSPDGNSVVYRTASFKDKLIYRDLKSFDLTKATKKQILEPTREDITIVADKSSVRIRNTKGHIAGTNDKNAFYAIDDFERINIVKGETIKSIDPLPDSHSYQWASLSPKGDKVIFTEPFQGVFICSTDGSNSQKLLPKGDSPRWINDNFIVAVVTKDDGYGIISSSIVAVEISTGKTFTLTDDTIKVTEVSVCPATMQMAYSALDGKIYLTNLVIR